MSRPFDVCLFPSSWSPFCICQRLGIGSRYGRRSPNALGNVLHWLLCHSQCLSRLPSESWVSVQGPSRRLNALDLGSWGGMCSPLLKISRSRFCKNAVRICQNIWQGLAWGTNRVCTSIHLKFVPFRWFQIADYAGTFCSRSFLLSNVE